MVFVKKIKEQQKSNKYAIKINKVNYVRVMFLYNMSSKQITNKMISEIALTTYYNNVTFHVGWFEFLTYIK
jgi:hypothetical protein